MGIQALPDTTVRAIGATQVLTDPAALVKELVDNALDAHATSIAVEIHHNTLDIVQVRDNGHGIAPEDRPLAARRYCTSKLLDYDDLKDIGGSSLGFRGEALASAAELSGSLTISTRIEGEQVGAALKINQKGEVTAQDRASLPVGTCVKITDFIKSNPVRRQVTLKNADASLKKIKRCLQAYAFARPHVRYSLRVLKAKTNKGDWVYAPKPDGNAEDAAIKLVGSACASQCLWSVFEHEGFSFQAFLPRPDADASKVGGHGMFISVDARPVSSARGHFKQIGKAFREGLKTAGSNLSDVKEPFLYLEISCPKESYDINVEPAKDDVAFEDASKVILGMKKLFNAVYAPRTEAQSPAGISQQVVDSGITADNHEVDLEAERPRIFASNEPADAPSFGEMIEDQLRSHAGREDEQAPAEPRRAFRSNMYGCDEEDFDLLDRQPQEDQTAGRLEELRRANRDVTVSNPWVLAKLNGSVRRPIAEQPSIRDDQPTMPTDLLSSPIRRGPTSSAHAEAALPTPRPSSPSPTAFHPSDHVPDLRLGVNGNVISGGIRLPPPQMYTPVPSSDPHEPEESRMRRRNESPSYNYNLTPQTFDPRDGTPLEAIPDITTRSNRSPRRQGPQGRVNKPFVPPFKDGPPREKVWFDHLENVERRPRAPTRPQLNNSHGLVMQGELGDLVEDPRPLTPPRRNRDIRDFVGGQGPVSVASLIEAHTQHRGTGSGPHVDQENRAADETVSNNPGDLRRHGFIRASDIVDLDNELESPEKSAVQRSKRRKTSERRALQDLSTNAPVARESVDEDNDEYRPTTTTSRAPSRRRSSHKLGRTKSSKLPLERTPPGQAIHNVVLPMPTSMDSISKLAGKIDEEHSLLGFGQPAIDLDSVFTSGDPLHLEELTNNLHALLMKVGKDTADEDGHRAEGLAREVQNAFMKHSTIDDGGEGDEVMSSI